jgi:hypothetical protein
MGHRTRASLLPLAALALLGMVACSSVPQSRPHEEIVRAELGTVIALKGSPCGEVIEYAVDEGFDYRVVCESGHAYRIQVTGEGHVATTVHSRPLSSTPQAGESRPAWSAALPSPRRGSHRRSPPGYPQSVVAAPQRRQPGLPRILKSFARPARRCVATLEPA